MLQQYFSPDPKSVEVAQRNTLAFLISRRTGYLVHVIAMETGHALSHDDSVLQADTGTGDTLALSVTKLSSLLLTTQRQKEPLIKGDRFQVSLCW